MKKLQQTAVVDVFSIITTTELIIYHNFNLFTVMFVVDLVFSHNYMAIPTNKNLILLWLEYYLNNPLSVAKQ